MVCVQQLLHLVICYNLQTGTVTLVCQHQDHRHQFRMLVNEYASALCNEKDYISCGNLTDLMFIKECNNTRFSVGELDTIIEFLCVS